MNIISRIKARFQLKTLPQKIQSLIEVQNHELEQSLHVIAQHELQVALNHAQLEVLHVQLTKLTQTGAPMNWQELAEVNRKNSEQKESTFFTGFMSDPEGEAKEIKNV